MTRFYFDHNATTPLCSESRVAMEKNFDHFVGNPSSVHSEGREAKKLLHQTREMIADFLGVAYDEIFFTSGCTEAINLLIQGLQAARFLSTRIEHSAVFRVLEERARVLFFEVSKNGSPDQREMEKVLQEGDCVVLSAANSETGTLLDIDSFSSLCARHNASLIIDGTQLMGKLPFRMPQGVTAMTFSAHKFGGPTGIGFFYMKKKTPLIPLMRGGLQESRLRPGTENLLGIAGLKGAIERLMTKQTAITAHLRELRDRFEETLLQEVPGVQINGEGQRLPNTSNLAFMGVSAEELLILLDQAGIAASHGSACSSGALEPSRVLLGMGYDRQRVLSSVRFSFGATNTLEEIDKAVAIIKKTLSLLSI